MAGLGSGDMKQRIEAEFLAAEKTFKDAAKGFIQRSTSFFEMYVEQNKISDKLGATTLLEYGR